MRTRIQEPYLDPETVPRNSGFNSWFNQEVIGLPGRDKTADFNEIPVLDPYSYINFLTTNLIIFQYTSWDMPIIVCLGYIFTNNVIVFGSMTD